MTATILIASTIMNLLGASCWNNRGVTNVLIRMAFVSAATGTAILAASHLELSI